MPEETMTDWVQDDSENPFVEMEKPEEPETKEETETPPASSPETKPEEENPSTEGEHTQPEENLPFHKHPRWKEIVDKNNALQERVEELSQIKEQLSHLNQPNEEVPQWYTKLYGDEATALWPEYKKYEDQRAAAIKQEAVREVESKEEHKRQEESRIMQYIDTEIKTLRDEGLAFDENALKKLVLEKQLFNSEGKLNFRAGLELMQIKSNPVQEAKKQIASKTAPTTGATPKSKGYVTAEDIRGKNWRSYKPY